MHFVVSIPNKPNFKWQTELLYHTFKKFYDASSFHVVMHLEEDNETHPSFLGVPPECMFYTKDFTHVVSGDTYSAYNKPYALKNWLEATPLEEDEMVALIDADMLIREPLPDGLNPSAVYASEGGRYGFMCADRSINLLNKFFTTRDWRALGVPYVASKKIWGENIDDWIASIKQLRNVSTLDPSSYLSWENEMMGWQGTLLDLDAPLHGIPYNINEIWHYDQGTRNSLFPGTKQEVVWSKHTYKPWSPTGARQMGFNNDPPTEHFLYLQETIDDFVLEHDPK